MRRILPHILGCIALGMAAVASAQVPPRPLPQPTAPLPRAPSPTAPAPLPGTISEPLPRPGNLEPLPPTGRQPMLGGAAPTEVQAAATGPRSVRVTWTAPADAESYWLYRQSGADTAFYMVGAQVTGLSGDDGGLLPGTAYRYKVAAYYPSVMRRRPGMSAAADATTPSSPPPGGLTAAVAGRYRVNVAWQPLAGANAYRLYRDGQLLTEIRPVQFEPTRSVLPNDYADSLPAGPHQYQLQAVFRLDAAEATSEIVPTPPVPVSVAAWFCTAGAP